MSTRIGYLGFGSYVPETELTNEDLERLVNPDDEWIRRRTGVRTRRVLNGEETILDMAAEAGRRALADAGVEPDAIGEVRVAVTTWLRLPSLSNLVQRELGLDRASAADVSAGCAGFVYAVEDAWNKITAERERYGRRTLALVVGVDGLSHITDYTDRNTAVLMGDGAGAVVMGEVAEGGILATHTGADGRHAGLLFTEPPKENGVHGNGHPKVTDRGAGQHLRMDGRRVYAAAVKTMVAEVHAVLERHRAATGEVLEPADIAYVYPHQANLRIIEKVAQLLELDDDRVYKAGIVKYGNTSAASIPLAYCDTRERAVQSRGYEVDVAFGAGFSSGAILREVVPAAARQPTGSYGR